MTRLQLPLPVILSTLSQPPKLMKTQRWGQLPPDTEEQVYLCQRAVSAPIMALATAEYSGGVNLGRLGKRPPKISRNKGEKYEGNGIIILPLWLGRSNSLYLGKIKFPGLRNGVLSYCIWKNNRFPTKSNQSISSLEKPKSEPPGRGSHVFCE